jgi:hypothetical protein
VIREAGAEIRGLLSEEGRLDLLYRELVGAGEPARGETKGLEK